MNPNRLRWGALAWLATLQFFVVETVAQRRYVGSYSRAADVISDLGAADSAARQAMNASFVLQAALILGGVLLLRPVLPGGAGRAASVLLGGSAVGVLLVGVFPADGNGALHATGAVLYLVGGGVGLIALAYAVRRRSEALGTALALLGLAGTAATIFFVAAVTDLLGEGGTERVAAYVLPLGLALAGGALWRLGRRPARTPAEDAGPSRREPARSARAERERERDEALESAARRTGGPAGDGVGDDDPDDDPWAAPARRHRDQTLPVSPPDRSSGRPPPAAAR